MRIKKGEAVSGAYSGICPGGLNFFLFPGGGLSTRPENPLKSIDFTGQGWA